MPGDIVDGKFTLASLFPRVHFFYKICLKIHEKFRGEFYKKMGFFGVTKFFRDVKICFFRKLMGENRQIDKCRL